MSTKGSEGCAKADLCPGGCSWGEDLLKLETGKRVVVGLWELEIKIMEGVGLLTMARYRYDYVAKEGQRTRLLAERSSVLGGLIICVNIAVTKNDCGDSVGE